MANLSYLRFLASEVGSRRRLVNELNANCNFRDPQTMSLLIGFFFTVTLVGYILVCYVLSHFVSVKYRRDYKYVSIYFV